MAKPKALVMEPSKAWEDARSSHLSFVKQLEILIPGYGYGDAHQASLTDEKLCTLLVAALRKSKNRAFDIVSFIFESHVEEVLDTKFQRLRDDIDIFSDEVKVRKLAWQPLPRHYLEMIIKRDVTLVHNTAKLNFMLNNVCTLLTGYRRIDRKVFDVERISRVLEKAKELVKVLVRAFKEREAIFNIQQEDLEGAYERIRKEIAFKF